MRKIFKHHLKILFLLIRYFISGFYLYLIIIFFLLNSIYPQTDFLVRKIILFIIFLIAFAVGTLTARVFYEHETKEDLKLLQLKYIPVLLLFVLFAFWFGFFRFYVPVGLIDEKMVFPVI